MRFYEIPDTLTKEVDQFERDIQDFVDGKIDPVKFKAIRVAHGVYEQRQNDTYMIRIRCAAGGITPTQLKRVGELARDYGSDEVHFTTRQEVQVHNVLIHEIIKVIRGLNEVHLSSRGGGGNTIRNILTPVDSGISENEVLDVDPYAMALTSKMINEEDSWNLPRKFKIAFSNNEEDTSYTQATCLGFVATEKDGEKGFSVYCAGGMGAKPMVGHELLAFIPPSKVYQVTKAIKVMFDKNGTRRSKFSSRIKFLWKKVEREEFVRLFLEEYNKIKDDESLSLVLPSIENKAKDTDLPVETASGDAFETWKSRYVYAQKQEGLSSIKIPLRLGDLQKEDADSLCDFLNHFGDNTIRCDRAQNIRLRNIPNKYLGNAYHIISGLGDTLVTYAPFVGNMINCTGAQTCKLGICLPRGLSSAITDVIGQSDLDLDSIPEFRLNMSGCPNTCGMHHIADLGFFGKVGRNDGDMYPSYNVLAGAKTGMGKTQYAERLGEVAAHYVPQFVHEFLKVWIEKKKSATYANYHAFLEAEGNTLIKTLCDKYKDVPSFTDEPKYYTDFGAKRRLSLDEIGTAECSAGVFDMIDVDKKSIKSALKDLKEGVEGEALESVLYTILFAASRMLLVTRGLDTKTEDQVFRLFNQHFIKAGLVSEDYSFVVMLGQNNERSMLPKYQETIVQLSEAVNELYSTMDDSLRFKEVKKPEEAASEGAGHLEKDYRGVACPMNFVKTKLVLETMGSGETLKILLDDGEPIQNVPNSVKLEGHKILETSQQGDHWEVVIQKN